PTWRPGHADSPRRDSGSLTLDHPLIQSAGRDVGPAGAPVRRAPLLLNDDLSLWVPSPLAGEGQDGGHHNPACAGYRRTRPLQEHFVCLRSSLLVCREGSDIVGTWRDAIAPARHRVIAHVGHLAADRRREPARR